MWSMTSRLIYSIAIFSLKVVSTLFYILLPAACLPNRLAVGLPARINFLYFIEGNLEVKLQTIWTVGKAEVVRVREEKRRREKIREEKE